MKRILILFLLTAFIAATFVMMAAVSAPAPSPEKRVAKMIFQKNFEVANMSAKAHLRNNHSGPKHCMDLRPIDKRALKLGTVEKAKEWVVQSLN
jgi:hypothetical protein